MAFGSQIGDQLAARENSRKGNEAAAAENAAMRAQTDARRQQTLSGYAALPGGVDYGAGGQGYDPFNRPGFNDRDDYPTVAINLRNGTAMDTVRSTINRRAAENSPGFSAPTDVSAGYAPLPGNPVSQALRGAPINFFAQGRAPQGGASQKAPAQGGNIDFFSENI